MAGLIARIARPARVAAATLSVVIALTGIWLSAVSERETKHATQLSLLTQLDLVSSASENQIVRADLAQRICDDAPLSGPDHALLLDALQRYEYFAWLMNSGQLDRIPDVRAHWTPRILDTEALGERGLDRHYVRVRYPELWRLTKGVSNDPRPHNVCTPG
jgi:hypothetical protein